MPDLLPPSVSAAGSRPQPTIGRTLFGSKPKAAAKAKPKKKAVAKNAPKAAPKAAPVDPAAAAREAFIRNMGDVSTTLTGDSLVDAADQLTDRQYRPQREELDRQGTQVIGQRDQQQRWARDYGGQLNNVFAGAVGAQGAANAEALATSEARRQATLAAIGQGGAQAQARQTADVDVRGGELAAGGAVPEATSAAQARAAIDAQAQQAAAQEGGDAQAAFLRNLQVVAAQQAGEAQQQIGGAATARLGDLDADRKSLSLSEGEDRTKNLLTLRQGEVERFLTEKGISSDSQQAVIDAEMKAAEIKTQQDLAREKMRHETRLRAMGVSADEAKRQADQQFKAEQNRLDRESREGIAGRRGSSAFGGVKEQGAAQSGIEAALAAARGLKGEQKLSRAEAARYLLQGAEAQPVFETVTNASGSTSQRKKLNADGTPQETAGLEKSDPLWASVALDMAYDGHISAHNVKRLHARGVKISSLGYPTRSSKPKPSGAAAYPAKGGSGAGQ